VEPVPHLKRGGRGTQKKRGEEGGRKGGVGKRRELKYGPTTS